MTIVATDHQQQRQWMAQWRKAGEALTAVRARELAALTPADALAAANTLLSLAAVTPLPERRRTWSGLIDFQRLLHRRRR
jgi:hypothetical protein